MQLETRALKAMPGWVLSISSQVEVGKQKSDTIGMESKEKLQIAKESCKNAENISTMWANIYVALLLRSLTRR